jgi:toxic protein SymE
MGTNKSKQRQKILRPAVRSLKIYPKHRAAFNSSKEVPEIRLCGNWLEKLGFIHGRKITVTTMDELLIIRLQTETPILSQQ